MELLYPERKPVTLEQLRAVVESSTAAAPFHGSVTGVCTSLSQRLFRDPEARNFAELQALAFSIRAAELHRLKAEFDGLARRDRVLVPRGIVFHVPPRNVDTMFVYSWLLAALTGNRNVIRLSPQRSRSTNVLLQSFCEALAEAQSPARNSTVLVSYGHDDAPTELLSSLCDGRVIWGGDDTVAAIRRAPLIPQARDLTFPDRYAIAAIQSDAYMDADEAARQRLTEQFFNDCFWFDQMACSSPRLVIWCGGRPADASGDFFPRLNAYAERRGYLLPPAAVMHKFRFSCSAILDAPVTRCVRLNALTVMRLESLARFDRHHPGGGLFFEVFLERLNDILPVLERKDQTLTWFGFPAEELLEMVRSVNGRGLDRLVKVGQALQFQRFWDGFDLLQEFCRHIFIQQ